VAHHSGRNISNIVLIGMPGAGKSTIGVVLAKILGLGFIDTDILIQQKAGTTLQEIVDTSGYLALREIEEKILLQTDLLRHVVATGGSAVYSHRAMSHLRARGWVVFLRVGLAELQRRVGDDPVRGIARRPDQSFCDLFQERSKLYEGYADAVIDCDRRTTEDICAEIVCEFRVLTE
jgi:shikimate kinase